MNRPDLSLFLKFLKEMTGLEFGDVHHGTIQEIVKERACSFGVSESHYFDILERDPKETQIFINQSTINETYFFREEKHFDILKESIFPSLDTPSIYLWSATCSTGEEAISLSLLAHECLPSHRQYRVIATDLNTQSLFSLKHGNYSQSSFRTDGSKYHPMVYSNSQVGQGVQVLPRIRDKIEVVPKNLYKDALNDIPDGISVIFFRNTLIYMPQSARGKVVSKLVEKMTPGGYLFVGASEVPFVFHSDLENKEKDGVFFFARKFPPSRPPKAKPKMDWPISAEKKEASEEEADLQKVLHYAQRPDLEGNGQSSNVNEVAARKILEIVKAIGREEFLRAVYLLSEIRRTMENELISYLAGYLEMAQGEKGKALAHFREAISYNFRFWPAFFYMAHLLKQKNPKEAKTHFTRCKEILEKSEETDQYHFLMDNFNTHYFLEMCVKQLKSLNERVT